MNAECIPFIKPFRALSFGLRMTVCAVSLMMAGRLAAQLPDVPQAAAEQNMQSGPPKQPKPILSFFPDLSTESVDEKLPQQTVQEKFMVPTRNTLNAWSAIKPALAAGYKEARNTTPELGHGAAGFGSYYWHTVVDETSENYLVQFVFPVMTHENTRYYRLGRNGFWRRTGYAVSRAVVTRDDAGREVFNTSEIGGAAAAAGLANLYYPGPERSAAHTTERWGLNVGFNMLTFATKEFWPDVDRKVFKGRWQGGGPHLP